MRIRRAIIIPAILALGAAGSILAGSAVSVAAAQAPAPTCWPLTAPALTCIITGELTWRTTNGLVADSPNPRQADRVITARRGYFVALSPN